MDDLISRKAAIDAFDDERVDRNYGDVSPESVIKVIESIPAVDAVPVEWLNAQIMGYASALKSTELKALVLVKQMWQKEQEAQDG